MKRSFISRSLNSGIAFILISSIFSPLSSAFGADGLHSFQVYEHQKKGGVEEITITLPGLLDQNYFETANFRVIDCQRLVDGKLEERTLSTLIADEDLKQRAASVLYHFEKARTFYIKELGMKEIEEGLPEAQGHAAFMPLPKAVIRLNMPYEFDDREKVNFKKDDKFNNVQTIERRIGVWDSEFWFRPKKEIPVSEFAHEASRNAVKAEVNYIRKLFLDLQLDLGVRNIVQGLFGNAKGSEFLITSLGGQARSLLFAEALFVGFKAVNRIFEGRNFHIIPELIPEVVYHEYAHYAFQNYLVPSHSTPAPEAIANFFAAVIIDDPIIAAKFHKAFNGRAQSGKSTEGYTPRDDLSSNVRNDFNLSFLWQLQREDVFGEKTARELVIETVRSGKLNTLTATINPAFKNALYQTLLTKHAGLPAEILHDEVLTLLGYYAEKELPSYIKLNAVGVSQ